MDMNKRKVAFRSPLPHAMRLALTSGALGCALFSFLYYAFGKGWMYSCAISFGMIAYHMLVRFASSKLLWIFFHRNYDIHSRWFREKLWEKRLYQILKVHKWKNRALTYDPSEFSLRCHTLEEIIENMCHAEAVHELIVVFSLLSLLFSIPFGSPEAFAITGVAAALFDSIFIIIQRYNRPRLIQIALRRQERNRPC